MRSAGPCVVGSREIDGRAALSVTSHKEACAQVAARFSSPWLRRYVGSKLNYDPLFSLAYDFFSGSAEPILDIGCGVGLLPFYLRERGLKQPIIGIDIDARKIRRAIESAERGGYEDLVFVAQDVAGELPASRGNVAVFDLLHYLPPDEQQRLLRELVARVTPGGLLLLRDCPRDGSPRYRATHAAEIFAQMISWNWSAPLHFATADAINSAFDQAEFDREERSARGGKFFNNRLFIFRRRRSAVAPVTG